MTNVVITYTGNVCSTPMVAYAGISGDVFVPALEKFDQAKFQAIVPDPAQQSAELAVALSALYERRPAAVFEHPRYQRYLGWKDIPSALEVPHVMFKWRPFLPDMRDSHLIAPVFARHEVIPALLVRRSVVEQATKVFMTEKFYGSSHQQFAVATMTDEAYSAYMTAQRGIQVVISRDEMLVVRKKAMAYLTRTKNLISATRYHFPHVASPRIFISEDIFRPALDRARFNAVLSRLLGAVRPLAEQSEPRVRKAGLDLSHCVNLEDVFADAELQAAENQYKEVIASLDQLLSFTV